MKKELNNLVGEIVKHKKFGRCEVVRVLNGEEGKIICKILDSGETKTLVFSKQFFMNISSYETKDILIKAKRKQLHKEVDYKKYRNHPLIKEIDRKEFGYVYNPVVENENKDELEEDSQ